MICVDSVKKRKRASHVFAGNGGSNVLFGGDDSELCFARGNFYSQLLLKSLDLSSSAGDERTNSLKSFFKSRQ